MPSVTSAALSPQQAVDSVSRAWTGAQRIRARYSRTFGDAAARESVDPDFLMALSGVETSGLERFIRGPETSSAGAAGIGQFIPSTWSEVTARLYGEALPQSKRFDPEVAVPAMARYVRELLDRSYIDSYAEAAAAYNWGPGNVLMLKRGEKDSMPRETAKYVPAVMESYRRLGGAPSDRAVQGGGAGGGGAGILVLAAAAVVGVIAWFRS